MTGVQTCALPILHDDNTRHSREVVDDIRGFFTDSRDQQVPWSGARVLDPPIRRNIKLAECPSFGQTIFEYAPGCPGAQDYGALAQSLIDEWDELLERRRQQQAAPQSAAAPAPEIVVTENTADARGVHHSE